jgi:hypothetical protein
VNEISHGGCYIEKNQLLSVGTEAQLRFTIADTLLDIGAKVVSNHPAMGMGMEFMAVSQEQKSKLAQILRTITVTNASPAAQQAENSQPSTAAVRITREAAPDILSKIIKRINEKGVLTRQELVDIVITKQMDSRM